MMMQEYKACITDCITQLMEALYKQWSEASNNINKIKSLLWYWWSCWWLFLLNNFLWSNSKPEAGAAWTARAWIRVWSGNCWDWKPDLFCRWVLLILSCSCWCMLRSWYTAAGTRMRWMMLLVWWWCCCCCCFLPPTLLILHPSCMFWSCWRGRGWRRGRDAPWSLSVLTSAALWTSLRPPQPRDRGTDSGGGTGRSAAARCPRLAWDCRWRVPPPSPRAHSRTPPASQPDTRYHQSRVRY